MAARTRGPGKGGRRDDDEPMPPARGPGRDTRMHDDPEEDPVPWNTTSDDVDMAHDKSPSSKRKRKRQPNDSTSVSSVDSDQSLSESSLLSSDKLLKQAERSAPMRRLLEELQLQPDLVKPESQITFSDCKNKVTADTPCPYPGCRNPRKQQNHVDHLMQEHKLSHRDAEYFNFHGCTKKALFDQRRLDMERLTHAYSRPNKSKVEKELKLLKGYLKLKDQLKDHVPEMFVSEMELEEHMMYLDYLSKLEDCTTGQRSFKPDAVTCPYPECRYVVASYDYVLPHLMVVHDVSKTKAKQMLSKLTRQPEFDVTTAAPPRKMMVRLALRPEQMERLRKKKEEKQRQLAAEALMELSSSSQGQPPTSPHARQPPTSPHARQPPTSPHARPAATSPLATGHDDDEEMDTIVHTIMADYSRQPGNKAGGFPTITRPPASPPQSALQSGDEWYCALCNSVQPEVHACSGSIQNMALLKVQCRFCPLRFKDHARRNVHFNRKHDMIHQLEMQHNQRATKDRRTEQTCPYCPMKFRYWRALKDHINHKNCPPCQQPDFDCKEALNQYTQQKGWNFDPQHPFAFQSQEPADYVPPAEVNRLVQEDDTTERSRLCLLKTLNAQEDVDSFPGAFSEQQYRLLRQVGDDHNLRLFNVKEPDDLFHAVFASLFYANHHADNTSGDDIKTSLVDFLLTDEGKRTITNEFVLEDFPTWIIDLQMDSTHVDHNDLIGPMAEVLNCCIVVVTSGTDFSVHCPKEKTRCVIAIGTVLGRFVAMLPSHHPSSTFVYPTPTTTGTTPATTPVKCTSSGATPGTPPGTTTADTRPATRRVNSLELTLPTSGAASSSPRNKQEDITTEKYRLQYLEAWSAQQGVNPYPENFLDAKYNRLRKAGWDHNLRMFNVKADDSLYDAVFASLLYINQHLDDRSGEDIKANVIDFLLSDEGKAMITSDYILQNYSNWINDLLVDPSSAYLYEDELMQLMKPVAEVLNICLVVVTSGNDFTKYCSEYTPRCAIAIGTVLGRFVAMLPSHESVTATTRVDSSAMTGVDSSAMDDSGLDQTLNISATERPMTPPTAPAQNRAYAAPQTQRIVTGPTQSYMATTPKQMQPAPPIQRPATPPNTRGTSAVGESTWKPHDNTGQFPTLMFPPASPAQSAVPNEQWYCALCNYIAPVDHDCGGSVIYMKSCFCQCKYCPLRFKSKSTKQRHQDDYHHIIYTLEKEHLARVAADKRKKQTCPHCEKSFKDWELLKKHIKFTTCPPKRPGFGAEEAVQQLLKYKKYEFDPLNPFAFQGQQPRNWVPLQERDVRNLQEDDTTEISRLRLLTTLNAQQDIDPNPQYFNDPQFSQLRRAAKIRNLRLFGVAETDSLFNAVFASLFYVNQHRVNNSAEDIKKNLVDFLLTDEGKRTITNERALADYTTWIIDLQMDAPHVNYNDLIGPLAELLKCCIVVITSGTDFTTHCSSQDPRCVIAIGTVLGRFIAMLPSPLLARVSTTRALNDSGVDQ